MLQSLFETVLRSSLMGTFAAFLVLLLRPISRRLFSPDWQYYIWLLVLNAFILPIPKGVTVTYLPQTAPILYRTAWNAFEEVRVTPPLPEGPDVMAILATVWGIGILTVAVFKLVRYALFKGQLFRHSVPDTTDYQLPCQVSVRRTWLVDAPLVIGLIRPILYLPESVDSEELPYILAHESVHCKRRDLLFKWYAQAVGVLHWFNPVLLLVARQIDAECEASCDRAVTRHWDSSETDAYMRMILDRSSASVFRPLTTKMFGGKAVLKRRFSAIRHPGKRRTLSVITALALCVTLLWFGSVLAADSQTRQVVLFDNDVKIPRAEASVQVPELPTEEALPAVPLPAPPVPEPLPEEEPLPDLPVAETPVAEVPVAEEPAPTEQARINYHSDLRTTTNVTVYPDAEGVISFRFESPVPNATAEINIRRADHPAGWGYYLPTDSETLYTFDGFTPGASYVLTLNAYCAGRYGIEGALVIY